MPRSPRRTAALVVAPLLGLTLLPAGCDAFYYDSPPRPSIEGLVDGALTDPKAPLIIRFSEPIDPASLKVSGVRLVLDLEGNLGDEDDDGATTNTTYFGYNPETANTFGAEYEFFDENRALKITPAVSLPIGPSLALLIEPGLVDLEGNEWLVRQRLVFGYKLSCDGTSGGTDRFPSGAYFFLVNVENPIQVQIQLYGQIEVDPTTGRFVGQFTNADRNRDPDRCSPPCDADSACRLLPGEECVAPSQKAGSEDEFSDFLPNPTPPAGYTFPITGCVVEVGDDVVFVNEPAVVDIQVPDVLVEGIQLTASFVKDGDIVRGTGGVTAEKIFLGESDSGAGNGTTVARQLLPEETPPGIPGPSD